MDRINVRLENVCMKKRRLRLLADFDTTSKGLPCGGDLFQRVTPMHVATKEALEAKMNCIPSDRSDINIEISQNDLLIEHTEV